MSKFDEKTRFLRIKVARDAQKCERKRLKNAVGTSRTMRVFQKLTACVSRVKHPVDQFEMGSVYPSSIALRRSSSEGRTLRTSSADL